MEAELNNKTEDTYLWVSLACKRLERVRRDEALKAIQELPPGLDAFYHRIFDQLSHGESTVVKSCMRLLKVMMLAYRPLNMLEVGSVAGFSDLKVDIGALVDRCASFIKTRGTNIEFVHQSARDYLVGNNGVSPLDAYAKYGHGDVALSCVTYLAGQLKANLIDLPRPNSTRESLKELEDNERNTMLAHVDYAATFWVQHLSVAKHAMLIQDALAEQGEVGTFLRTKLLEWLECLSLLDELHRAIEALKVLTDIAEVGKTNVDTSNNCLTNCPSRQTRRPSY